MQTSEFLDILDYTELMFYLLLCKIKVMIGPISSRGLKMAHERLMCCSMNTVGQVLANIAIDLFMKQDRWLTMSSGGKR